MLQDRYDIVIVGAGPVGLLLSLCLSRWGYKVKHVDNRAVPTKTGRADGIQPRSMEILQNLGLSRKLMAYDPAKVYNVAFWDPLPNGKGICRTGNWPSCPDFIDTRYSFTALLHQGKIERVFLDEIEKAGTVVERPSMIVGFENDGKDVEYPVKVELQDLDTNVCTTVRAKYLFGGEGARSFVRERQNIKIRHKDPIAHVWGVVDGVVRTNFPDIKTKCTIHSDHGSIMVIPREEDMVRLYVQLASSTEKNWNPRMTATVSQVQEAAIKVFKPYEITWDRIEWYSVYPIGQGIAEKYTLDHRIFIGGDACHTHSPKAGQGMNTAFHDALNLAWKIHLVEGGMAKREILTTYESERKMIAEKLLDFDAKYAKLFSTRIPSGSEVDSALGRSKADDTNEFVQAFKAACEFTSGYGVAYTPTIFTWSSSHPAQSPLFNPKDVKLIPGRALVTCTVTRVLDSNPVALEQEVPANGSFRIFILAGDINKTKAALADFNTHLQKSRSFYSTYSRPADQVVSYFERHNPHSRFFSLLLVFANGKDEVEISTLPSTFQAYAHHIYADDRSDRFVPGAKAPAHAKMGFSSEKGGVVVVRPDGHVACSVALVEGPGTVEALNQYFGSFSQKLLGEAAGQCRL
ncbi:hypothetical protein PRK78_002851 [Emydomyces testavorans]|uniref:Phenol 2-monooxygenase n=1 Tax=Emydomyces testavorans TaxID=2070801 RepID=A0AAF0DF21_9EURO|nr:hypothetical protein PRK78_002851 [Emydomyces testavorans]